ncbi:unnamed protein product [Amoebophrya sp. A25]|nr:unnamed protein product [Amoebophrya sp. A25]|eukprot:GSA25T00019633001.1
MNALKYALRVLCLPLAIEDVVERLGLVTSDDSALAEDHNFFVSAVRRAGLRLPALSEHGDKERSQSTSDRSVTRPAGEEEGKNDGVDIVASRMQLGKSGESVADNEDVRSSSSSDLDSGLENSRGKEDEDANASSRSSHSLWFGGGDRSGLGTSSRVQADGMCCFPTRRGGTDSGGGNGEQRLSVSFPSLLRQRKMPRAATGRSAGLSSGLQRQLSSTSSASDESAARGLAENRLPSSSPSLLESSFLSSSARDLRDKSIRASRAGVFQSLWTPFRRDHENGIRSLLCRGGVPQESFATNAGHTSVEELNLQHLMQSEKTDAIDSSEPSALGRIVETPPGAGDGVGAPSPLVSPSYIDLLQRAGDGEHQRPRLLAGTRNTKGQPHGPDRFFTGSTAASSRASSAYSSPTEISVNELQQPGPGPAAGVSGSFTSTPDTLPHQERTHASVVDHTAGDDSGGAVLGLSSSGTLVRSFPATASSPALINMTNDCGFPGACGEPATLCPPLGEYPSFMRNCDMGASSSLRLHSSSLRLQQYLDGDCWDQNFLRSSTGSLLGGPVSPVAESFGDNRTNSFQMIHQKRRVPPLLGRKGGSCGGSFCRLDRRSKMRNIGFVALLSGAVAALVGAPVIFGVHQAMNTTTFGAGPGRPAPDVRGAAVSEGGHVRDVHQFPASLEGRANYHCEAPPPTSGRKKTEKQGEADKTSDFSHYPGARATAEEIDTCTDWTRAGLNLVSTVEHQGFWSSTVTCGTCWAYATASQIEAQLALTRRDGILRRVDIGEIIACSSREERLEHNRYNGIPVEAVAAQELPVERLCSDGNVQTWVYVYLTQNGIRLLSEPTKEDAAAMWGASKNRDEGAVGGFFRRLFSRRRGDSSSMEDMRDTATAAAQAEGRGTQPLDVVGAADRRRNENPDGSYDDPARAKRDAAALKQREESRYFLSEDHEVSYPTNTYDDVEQDIPFRFKTAPRGSGIYPDEGPRQLYCQTQRRFVEPAARIRIADESWRVGRNPWAPAEQDVEKMSGQREQGQRHLSEEHDEDESQEKDETEGPVRMIERRRLVQSDDGLRSLGSSPTRADEKPLGSQLTENQLRDLFYNPPRLRGHAIEEEVVKLRAPPGRREAYDSKFQKSVLQDVKPPGSNFMQFSTGGSSKDGEHEYRFGSTPPRDGYREESETISNNKQRSRVEEKEAGAEHDSSIARRLQDLRLEDESTQSTTGDSKNNREFVGGEEASSTADHTMRGNSKPASGSADQEQTVRAGQEQRLSTLEEAFMDLLASQQGDDDLHPILDGPDDIVRNVESQPKRYDIGDADAEGVEVLEEEEAREVATNAGEKRDQLVEGGSETALSSGNPHTFGGARSRSNEHVPKHVQEQEDGGKKALELSTLPSIRAYDDDQIERGASIYPFEDTIIGAGGPREAASKSTTYNVPDPSATRKDESSTTAMPVSPYANGFYQPPKFKTKAEQEELQQAGRLTEVSVGNDLLQWHGSEDDIRIQLQKMPVVGLVDAQGLKKISWGGRWRKKVIGKEDFPSYTLTGSLHLKGDHYIQVVGLRRSEDGTLYWWCKNSWGRHWGDNGYFRLKYGDGLLLHAVTIKPELLELCQRRKGDSDFVCD